MYNTSVINESRIITDLKRIIIIIYNHTDPTLFPNMSYSQGSVPNFCSRKVVPDSLQILTTKVRPFNSVGPSQSETTYAKRSETSRM